MVSTCAKNSIVVRTEHNIKLEQLIISLLIYTTSLNMILTGWILLTGWAFLMKKVNPWKPLLLEKAKS